MSKIIDNHDAKHILDFLGQHPMATISTVDMTTMQPESALIAFAELDTLEIIFETFYDTRKYQNLQQNNKVALAVGWDIEEYITVQYEGEAHQIPEAEVDQYRTIFLQKDTPCTEEFLFHPHVTFFKVQPTWIRYSDYTASKPKIIELDFRKTNVRAT